MLSCPTQLYEKNIKLLHLTRKEKERVLASLKVFGSKKERRDKGVTKDLLVLYTYIPPVISNTISKKRNEINEAKLCKAFANSSTFNHGHIPRKPENAKTAHKFCVCFCSCSYFFLTIKIVHNTSFYQLQAAAFEAKGDVKSESYFKKVKRIPYLELLKLIRLVTSLPSLTSATLLMKLRHLTSHYHNPIEK